MDDQNGTVHTEFTDISSNFLKFLLKWGFFSGFLLNSIQNLVLACELSDNSTNEPPLSSLDLGS